MAAQPEPARGKSEAEGRTDLGAALSFVSRVQRRRCVVFVISDFQVPEDDPAGDWVDALARLSRKHDVIAARVSDPFEEELPVAGILALREIESGELIEVDTRSAAVRRTWSAAAHERRELFLAESARARVDTLELSTVGSVADPLLRLFASRGGRRGGV